MVAEPDAVRVRSRRSTRARSWTGGFTIIELLVATAIMLIVILVLFQVIAGMTNIWHNSVGTVSGFQDARAAFTVVNRELARATLKPYVDYINDPTVNNSPFGQFRSALTTSQQQTFVPYGFARASDLHFVCGATTQVLPSGSVAANNPGQAVFFQAPLGVVSANASSDKYLQQALNNVGFYIQYSDIASSTIPAWLETFFAGAPHYRYRLVECIEPTENFSVYQKETETGSYNLSWIPPASTTTFPVTGTTYSESVLAENVVLLIFRPRLEPLDEQALAPSLGATYTTTTANSIISPNYAYDSRAWSTGYSFSPTHITSTTYAKYMRNQLPPIVDIAMVCADPNSLARFETPAQTTPPAALQPASTLFVNSANMDADLLTFGQQLTANHIHYQVFRSSVQMQGAAWANQ